MRFEMIGVQFDKTRQQEIAAKILATFRRPTLADLTDDAAGDGKPAALDHAVGEHDLRVCQNEVPLFGHCKALRRLPRIG